jgi:TrmH family RNA methyltransferase
MVTDKNLMEEIVGIELNNEHAVNALVDVQQKKCPTIDKLLQSKSFAPPVIVLDDVRSSDNIGAILRTAFSFGITSAVLSKTSFGGLNARSARVSMGSMYHFDFICSDDIVETVRQMKAAGITVYRTCPSSGKFVHSHHDTKWGLLIGNEDHGGSEAALTACDELIRIPQVFGDSLTVSHAAAISLYELHKNHLVAHLQANPTVANM